MPQTDRIQPYAENPFYWQYQDKSMEVRWLDIRASRWEDSAIEHYPAQDRLPLITPREEGYWAVVVTVI